MNTGSKTFLTGLAVALISALSVPAQGGPGGSGNPGGGGGGNGKIITYIQSLPLQTVDATELATLVHLRQEEKLARDVYRALYGTWQLPAFDNIAASEQSHMDLVKVILDRYGIVDPLTSNQIGVFPDPFFTMVFNFLTAVGNTSLLHAQVVGAVIEDLDIYDLDTALASTDNRDIGTIWQNLQRGSRNHMRAFYGLLEPQGFVYPGVYLTFARIQAIVTSPWEQRPVDENGVLLP